MVLPLPIAAGTPRDFTQPRSKPLVITQLMQSFKRAKEDLLREIFSRIQRASSRRNISPESIAHGDRTAPQTQAYHHAATVRPTPPSHSSDLTSAGIRSIRPVRNTRRRGPPKFYSEIPCYHRSQQTVLSTHELLRTNCHHHNAVYAIESKTAITSKSVRLSRVNGKYCCVPTRDTIASTTPLGSCLPPCVTKNCADPGTAMSRASSDPASGSPMPIAPKCRRQLR